MAGIWVWAETREHTRELIGAAKQIAAWLGGGITALAAAREDAEAYLACGAGEVLLLPALPPEESGDALVPLLAEEVCRSGPDVFLVGATARGKEMAARLAARLNTGLCSECIALSYDEGSRELRMDRLVFGGAGVQTVVCTGRPQMATVPARVFEPAAAAEGNQGVIRELPPPPPGAVKVRERRPREKSGSNISEARVIVCAGRGLDKEEDLAMVRELASLLGGEVACTRPLAEELHWMAEETYIGLSGQQVKPQLYIGIGVSGQIQHTVGIRGARVICAVNRDEKAPIFQMADYGIVGDLYAAVPRLIEELKRVLQR